MVYKHALAEITYYESDPITTDEPSTSVPEIDDSIDVFDTDFKSIVQKFNRVILLIDDNSTGELPQIHLEPNKIEFDETVTKSLKRLQTEFDELEQQFNKDNQNLGDEHVKSLRQLLDQAKDKLLASTPVNSKLNAREMNSFIKPKVEYLPADLAKMSERLSTISSAVGQPSDPTKRFTQPLDFLVEELGLQLDSILPNEKMGPELTFVLNEHGKQSRDENTQKVNELYETLDRWNSECQALPLILERLRHCTALSEQVEQLLNSKLAILTSSELIDKALQSQDDFVVQTEKTNNDLLDLFKKVSTM